MRAALPLLIALAACTAPSTDSVFTRFELNPRADVDDARDDFLDVIDGARRTLDVALPAMEDVEIAEAVIAAWDRGVEVRAVTDYDQREDAGAVLLMDAGVPLALADDGIAYFDFNIKADVAWASEQTIMSHAWAIADRKVAVLATELGSTQEGTRITTRLVGEDVLIDLTTEHNQVFGGSDAVAVTQFDNMAKSIADYRWAYPTQTDQILEVWFGPQERLVKRIIDAVYTARSSAKVLTDEFASKALSDALKDKAAMGFDMEVVVGPRFESTAYFLSQELRNNTPGVVKNRICEDVHIPTIVLLDYEPARNGRQYPARAFVLSHDIYAALRLFRQDEVISDQLIDGNLLVFNDYDGPSGVMLTLQDTWDDHVARATGGLNCP